MKKTKTWIKDRISILNYNPGQCVVVARRKKNGHPRSMVDNHSYLIKRIENDCLILHNIKSGTPSELKVHWSYCLNLQLMRDEIINDLLKD